MKKEKNKKRKREKTQKKNHFSEDSWPDNAYSEKGYIVHIKVDELKKRGGKFTF